MLTFFLAVVLAQAVPPALPVQQALPSQEELAAADAATRREIMKNVDVRTDSAPETTFALIQAGLLDTDPEVRETAAGALRNLRATLLRRRIDPRLGRSIDVPATFLAALSNAVDSPDGAVRLQSIDALVSFGPDQEQIKTRLLERYTLEAAPLLRAQLLMHLRATVPDAATVRRVVLAALDDPETAVRYQGVLGVAAWTPDDLLARAGEGLDEADPAMRVAWAEALGAYGPRALPYLGKMQQLLGSATNQRDRHRLQAAVSSIRATPLPTPAPPGAAPR